MALEDILEHTATPVVTVEAAERVEYERIAEPVRGEPFPCVVFLPNTGMESRRGRRIEKPQMMYLPMYAEPPEGSGEAVQLGVGAQLGIVAPEQNLALGLDPEAEILWTVESSPQPLGRPGDEPVGMYVTLRKVKD